MRVLRSLAAMARWRGDHGGRTTAFVPTMGALHEGHLALFRAARRSAETVIVSIFVNPLQFGPREDYGRYPRSFGADRALCQREQIDLVFASTVEAMYSSSFQTTVQVQHLSRLWEGALRPGHFDGVAAVVLKLLNLIRPQVTIFGQKDYQQVLVVRQLVEDLNLGVKIDMYPTLREPDGLALSSRNRYLTAPQRAAAPILHQALQAGAQLVADGVRSASRIRTTMERMIQRERGVRVEYLAVCDPKSLEPVRRVDWSVVLLGAVRIGGTRLIDNVLAAPAGSGPRAGRNLL